MKKIFFDCQIFQTEAYNRGMGKYSLSLINELFKQPTFKDSFQIYLVFNKNLPLSQEKRIFFRNLDKKIRISELDLPTNLAAESAKKYKEAKRQLNEYIKLETVESEEIIFFLLAPFFVDFASAFPDGKNVYKISLVYDLIPHLIWKKQRIFPDDLYFSHYYLFFEAHKLFTISESVKTDLTYLLSLPEEKILSLNGGPFDRKIEPSAKKKSDYILFPSAPIFHKNNANAVKGFEKFNQSTGYKYKLVVTSAFDSNTQESLKKLSSKIEFTGTISDKKIAELYLNTSTLLLASYTEGLGMPVLEAVSYDSPVACSKIPVLEEISPEAFYFFDPDSPESIAKSLSLSTKKESWDKKLKTYEQIRLKYNWENSAKKLIDNLLKENTQRQGKPKINIICDDPRSDSPSAKFAEKIYPKLFEYFDVGVKILNQSLSKTPAFLPYLTHKDFANSKNLHITSSTRQPKNFAPEDIHVAIPNKLQKLALFFNKHKPTFLLAPRKMTINKPLEIDVWDYRDENSLTDKDVTKNIVNYIIRKTR